MANIDKSKNNNNNNRNRKVRKRRNYPIIAIIYVLKYFNNTNLLTASEIPSTNLSIIVQKLVYTHKSYH